MFGSYRFVLALLVVVTHIGHIEVIAGLAVWAFFMLSGFMMTGVLNTRYGFTTAGLQGFWTSRLLRLYPTYWVVALVSFLVTALFRHEVDPAFVNQAFRPMTEVREWFSSLFIFGHTTFGLGRVEHALSPPIWAVDVELSLYLISCLIVSRSRKTARYTMFASILIFPLLWVVAKMLIGAGDIETGGQLIYSFIPAAMLPYSIGAYLYFVAGDHNDKRPSAMKMLVASILVAVLALFISRYSVTAAYILSLPIFGYLTVSLSKVRTGHRLKRIDEILGHMSYPIYLAHYLCAYIVVLVASRLGFQSLVIDSKDGFMFEYTYWGFFIITLLVISFSAVLALYLESPMEKLRHEVVKRLSELK
jgi:peptidoglycan/LPS O-acetylase OafA/YrhL